VKTVFAVTATVADRLPDTILMVPAIPAPADVRPTIVVVLQDTRASGKTPMFAVTRVQSTPNFVPTITMVSFPTVLSWLLDETLVTVTETMFGGVLLTTSAYRYGKGLLR